MTKRPWYIYLLFPFSIFYWLIVGIRNILFNWEILSSRSFDIPVISVGNITVGGTGKTPHVEYMLDYLKDMFCIAVLSRGYKRKTHSFILAKTGSTPEDIGDEPAQIKRKFQDIHVAVDKKRVDGIQNLLRVIDSLEVIILDDAYQHRYVKPGLNILLIDYNRPLKKDLMLPAGRLREPSSQRRRADIIIITKCPSGMSLNEQKQWIYDYKLLPNQLIYFTTFEYDEPQAIFSEFPVISFKDIREKKMSVLLLTGIANPLPLKKYMESYTKEIRLLKYPDHYDFSVKDVKKISEKFKNIHSGNKILITTEKDAVRLRQYKEVFVTNKTNVYYIPIKVKLLFNQEEEFNNKLLSYIKTGENLSKN